MLIGNLTAERTIPSTADTESARLGRGDSCKCEDAKKDSNYFFHNQK